MTPLSRALALAAALLALPAYAQDAAAPPSPAPPPPAAPAGPVTLTATLLGDNEVPDDGDPDGKGGATIVLDPAKGTVCYDVDYHRVAPVTMAHIHAGASGKAGPPVVTLKPDADEWLKGCAKADAATIAAIAADPKAYYVNVHTTELPGGAIRGQLGG